MLNWFLIGWSSRFSEDWFFGLQQDKRKKKLTDIGSCHPEFIEGSVFRILDYWFLKGLVGLLRIFL
jgi:hypothetical protein